MAYCGLAAVVLLRPGTGSGLLDFSLIPSLDKPQDYYLLIAAQLCIAVYLWIPLARDERISKCTKLVHVLLLAFSLYIALNVVRHPRDIASLTCTANMLLNVMFFCFSLWFGRNTQSIWLFPVVFLGVFAVCTLAILHSYCLMQNPVGGSHTYYFGHRIRFSIFFDHPNHLGNLLSFGIVFCFSSLFAEGRTWRTILLWIFIAVLLFGLTQTYSRGAWFGCVVGFLASIARLRSSVAIGKLLSYCSFFLILLGLILVMTSSVNSFSARVVSTIPSVDASVGNRLRVWTAVAQLTQRHWLVGVGIGRFQGALDEVSETYELKRGAYASALNNFLTLTVETGIPTFVIFIIATLLACFSAASGKQLVNVRIGLLCGAYSSLIFSVTSYTLCRAYSALLTWGVFGFLASIQSDGCD